MKTILEKTDFCHIGESAQFFVYARNWWDGASVDLLGLYVNAEGEIIEQKWIAGESKEPKTSSLNSENEVARSYFEHLVLGFDLLDLNHFQKTRFYMHYDVMIGVKKEGGEHWITLSGGDSDNTQISQFADSLFDHLPIDFE